MGAPVRLYGSSKLQFAEGTHQPQLSIKVENDVETNNKLAKISFQAIPNMRYQPIVSPDLKIFKDYGPSITVDDFEGEISSVGLVNLEEISFSKPMIADKEFYQVRITNISGYEETIDIHGLTNDFNDYELARLNILTTNYAVESAISEKLFLKAGIAPQSRIILFLDKDPLNMDWNELRYWLEFVGIDTSCLDNSGYRTANYKSLCVTLLSLLEGRIIPNNSSKIPLSWINNNNSWSPSSLIYLYIQKGIDAHVFGAWRTVSSENATILFNTNIAPLPMSYLVNNDLVDSFTEFSLYKSLDDVLLLKHRKIIELYHFDEDEINQVLRNIANSSSGISQSINMDLNSKTSDAILWLQENGYPNIDTYVWMNNPYVTIAIYTAIKDIPMLKGDLLIDIEQLFSTYDETISNHDYKVNVLTEFLNLTDIYKGNSLFIDYNLGIVEYQLAFVSPRYSSILDALYLRKLLAEYSFPNSFMAETLNEIDILKSNVDFQKIMAFHRYVMDINMYYDSLKLADYVANNEPLSFSDYYAYLNNNGEVGLINYLASEKSYFETQINEGEYNIFIDTVGAHELLYSGQAIFVQEDGDLYYRINKIVMPSHFSLIEKAIEPSSGILISAMGEPSDKTLTLEQQRELWFCLIEQGYLSSEGVATQKFIDLANTADASIDRNQHIRDNFNLTDSFLGYEVSAFEKVSEMALGEWIPVTNKMIKIGGDNWVNSADHTIEIAKKEGDLYPTLKLMTNTYFDAASFVALFPDVRTLADMDALPYENGLLGDWCFELNELMSDNALFNQEIPSLLDYLEYRSAGANVVQAYLKAFFEKLNVVDQSEEGFPTINHAESDIEAVYRQLSEPITDDRFSIIDGLDSVDSSAIINILKTNGILDTNNNISLSFDITNADLFTCLNGTSYESYNHQVFTLLSVAKKNIEKKFFRIILNLIDIQSRLSYAERADVYNLEDYVYLNENFSNFASDDIVKLRNMFAMANILGRTINANSIQELLDFYDLTGDGNALDAVMIYTGGLMSTEIQGIVDEYQPIVDAVSSITDDIVCVFDNTGENSVLRLGEIKNIESLEVFHNGHQIYMDNDYSGLDFVKDIIIPNGSSIDELTLEIVYTDGTTDTKTVYPITIDATTNQSNVKLLEVLNDMSGELDNSLRVYGLNYGEELDDYRQYIAELGKMYISAKVLAQKSGRNLSITAADIVDSYATALIAQEFSDITLPDNVMSNVWTKVWVINNRDKLGLFDNSIIKLMMASSIDLNQATTEVTKQGERYQIMIGGEGFTHGADCGNTAAYGKANVIGVMDTFTGQILRTPKETIAFTKDVKWISDINQLREKQRDSAVEAGQHALSLKSFYACKMGENALAENCMNFDVQTDKSWRDVVADSEVAVASFAEVQENRKQFVGNLMRNVTGNNLLGDAEAKALYAKFLTAFEDYLPRDSEELSIAYPASPQNYIHKANEPKGFYLSKEAVLILQNMKNSGVDVQSTINNLTDTTKAELQAHINSNTLDKVKSLRILSENISLVDAPLVLEVGSLYSEIVKNVINDLFESNLSTAESIDVLYSIQLKYPNIVSAEERGSVGVATFAVLSYLKVINNKSLMSKFRTLNDLPEQVSLSSQSFIDEVLETEKQGTAFEFMKVTNDGMMLVTFSPSGAVTSDTYKDGVVRTKTMNSISSGAAASFTDDEFQVKTDSEVNIGAINSFSPIYPMSGAYAEYADWSLIGNIITSVIISTIIGDIAGAAANMAGVSDLYSMYRSVQTGYDVVKAGVTGEIHALARNIVGNIIPDDLLNMAEDMVNTYQQFENQYNQIKADIDQYIQNGSIQQLIDVKDEVEATLQTTQANLEQLKQDVINGAGDFVGFDEEQKMKAMESVSALERQVALTRYKLEQKLKNVENSIPEVDFGGGIDIGLSTIDPYAGMISKLESRQYEDQLIIGFDAMNIMDQIQGEGNIFVKVGDQLVATEITHNYQAGQNFLTVDVDALIASLADEGITLTDGQTIEIFGKEVTVSTSYNQADLSDELQEYEVLQLIGAIDRDMNRNYYDFENPLTGVDYNVVTGDVMVLVMPKNGAIYGTKDDMYAYMILEDLSGNNSLHKVKIGDLSQNPYAATKELTIWETLMHQKISTYELKNGLKVKGLSEQRKRVSVLGTDFNIIPVSQNNPLVMSNKADISVKWKGDYVDISITKELDKATYPYLIVGGIVVPIDASEFKRMYPNQDQLGIDCRTDWFTSIANYELSLSSLEKFLLSIDPQMDVRSYDLTVFSIERPLLESEGSASLLGAQLNDTNSVSIVAGNIYDQQGKFGLSYEEFWDEVAKDEETSLLELNYKEKRALYAGMYAYTALRTYETIYDSKKSSLPAEESEEFATRASVNAMVAWAYLLDVVRKEDYRKFDTYLDELTKIDYVTLGYNKAMPLNAERFFRSIMEITDKNLENALDIAELEVYKFDGKEDEITVVVHGIGMPYITIPEDNNSSWVDDVKTSFCNRKEEVKPFVWNSDVDNVPDGPVASLEYYLRNSNLELWKTPEEDPVIQLFEQLKQLKTDYPSKKINIIGHSLGSLITYRLLKGIENRDYEKKYGIDSLSYFNINNVILAGSPVAAFEDSSTVGFNDKNVDLINVWSIKDEFYLASSALCLANKIPMPKTIDVVNAILSISLFSIYGGDISSQIMGPINSANIDNIPIGSKHVNMLFDENYMQEIRQIYEEQN